MNEHVQWLLPLIPTTFVAGALLCRQKGGLRAGKLAVGAAWIALAACAVLALPGFGGTWRIAPWGADALLALALRQDAVSCTMALLVACLGLVVIRFSRNYLAGDAGQSSFFFWLQLTLASVLALVLAGNVQVLFLAWIATSLSLHQLLVYYPNRVPALFAARKKFVISRLGDACMLGAAVVLYRAQGSLDFDTLFAAAGVGKTSGLATAGGLFAVCAMFKSAQLPFHGWLPDTMETPTPVSALMHAGIINAGGFLIIRTSPLMVHAQGALIFLAVLGAITAAFGAVVMLTQPSVKRALAFSTIAQMGFMLLQCGLGGFALALLHIVAHSLYKAHAFLHAGSTIGRPARAVVPLRAWHLAGGMACGLAAMWVGYAIWRKGETVGVPPVLLLVLAISLSYGIARVFAKSGALGLLISGVAAVAFASLAIGLHKLFLWQLFSFPLITTPAWVSLVVGGVFIALAGLQFSVWRMHQTAWGRAFYVHALHGFYLGTLGNRLLTILWPPHPVRQAASSISPEPDVLKKEFPI